MDKPGHILTPAQVAANNRLRAAHAALNNLLANKENYPQGSPTFASSLTAAQSELAAAQAQYRAAFAAELASAPILGVGI